jgi:hypothetical protein
VILIFRGLAKEMIRLVCALVCVGTALAGCSEAGEEPRAAGEAAAPSEAPGDTLRIGFVHRRGAPRDPEVLRTAAGVRLGVEEAQIGRASGRERVSDIV